MSSALHMKRKQLRQLCTPWHPFPFVIRQAPFFFKLSKNLAVAARGLKKQNILCASKYINPTSGTSSNVPLVEFMYLVFIHMPGESYRRWLGSLLLYLCYGFWALINSCAMGSVLCSDRNMKRKVSDSKPGGLPSLWSLHRGTSLHLTMKPSHKGRNNKDLTSGTFTVALSCHPHKVPNAHSHPTSALPLFTVSE